MAEKIIKLPDVGEGVAEAEIAELNVKVGDLVREDQALATVMTDKATVEIPSPANGEVVWIGIEPRQVVAVGAPILRLKVTSSGKSDVLVEPSIEPAIAAATVAAAPVMNTPPSPNSPPRPTALAASPAPSPAAHSAAIRHWRAPASAPLAAPSVRTSARTQGIDLRLVPGSGPAGRILHEDLARYIAEPAPADRSGAEPNLAVDEIKVVGLRRRIAQRMHDTMSRIPHFAYIEEVDVTELEALRTDLNAEKRNDRPKLTVLPFIVRALVVALREFPQMNAHFDDAAEIVRRHGGVHVGIATQTSSGLVVPVLRHAETLDIWKSALGIARLAEAARDGSISRAELTGSTITITSLGALGGLATTPIINSPEVSIVGVNKISIRPVWRGLGFEPRKIMTLSSSFDHRMIDGFEAAKFIQCLRKLLESPSKIFLET